MSTAAGCAIAPAAHGYAVLSPFAPLDIAPRPAPRRQLDSPVTPDADAVAGHKPVRRAPYAAAPAASSGVVELEVAEPDDPPVTSRLSRARNLARRAAAAAAGSAAAKRSAVVKTDAAALDVEVEEVEEIVTDDDEHSAPPVLRSTARKRPRAPSPVRKERDKPRQLHPFFAAAAASAAAAKENRQKRPRSVRASVDAWRWVGATIHVNYEAPQRAWEQSSEKGVLATAAREVGVDCKRFPYYPSESNETMPSPAERQRLEVVKSGDVDGQAWAEKYKLDGRSDVISAGVTKELVDWLRPWYAVTDAEVQCSDSDSEADSYMASLYEQAPCDSDRIAVLTGPVGCGKSTVVSIAARQLGLTVLEVNASLCRTGKKVREVVQEALRTHRVAAGNAGFAGGVRFKQAEEQKSGSRPISAKTLILFEEVDKLQEDERGFWQCLQELASRRDCRRPIVCTANGFNSEMRQWFIEPKQPGERDLERILNNKLKAEQPVSPVSFKHIPLLDRSERQAAAVLKRVISSEKARLPKWISASLALLCRNDTRRAVNLLHFWGLPGLEDCEERQVSRSLEEGFNIVSAVAGEDASMMAFQVGSQKVMELSSSPPRRSPRAARRRCASKTKAGNLEDATEDALSTWSETLDLMSFSDTIAHACGEVAVRRGDRFEDGLPCYLDEALQSCWGVAEGLSAEALSYSRSSLSLDPVENSASHIAKELPPVYSPGSTGRGPEWLMRRRPACSDYLPSLRIMARKESSRTNGSDRDRSDPAGGGFSRRTRSRARKGGFSALDLHSSTVLDLTQSCLDAPR